MARPVSSSRIPRNPIAPDGGSRNIPKFLLKESPARAEDAASCGKPADTGARFYRHLALHLPEVAERIDQEDAGILHLAAGCLTLATRDAIAQRDWQTVVKHFDFAAEMLESADAQLTEALGVSYLGSLLHGETSINYAKARSLLPKPLALALVRVESHYEERHTGG